MAENVNALEMRGILKEFPGVLANDRVDFALRRGEVHALLGENGAGKSTLMNILCGLYQPDAGDIRLDGEPVQFNSPRDAIAHGIGMVHQHFMLVGPQTVAENVILGLRAPRFLLNLPKVEQEVAALSRQYGLKVDPCAHIWQLSVGEQQRVEILKTLYRGARILIMDEPTAVLTPQEVEDLFHTLRGMAADGKSIIFISHKLDEVLSIADRITVLRRGRVTASALDAKATGKAELAQLMVGRQVLFQVDKGKSVFGSPVLEAQDLRAENDKGLPALRGVSLTVRAGEIFGIAGVAGNGQSELAQVVTGLRPAQAGRVGVDGQDVSNRHTAEVIRQGVGHVPEDRAEVGSVPRLSVAENLILKSYREPPICLGWFLDPSAVRAQAERLVAEFEISTPTVDTPVRTLSGGNLQRLILAREMSAEPRLLVAMHPTRGLDVGATEAVHRLLIKQRERGAAILLISEDLDELLSLSDRIGVLFEGEIVGEVEAEKADIREIGLMMAGTKVGGSRSKALEFNR